MNQTSLNLPVRKTSNEERYQAFVKNSSEGIWRFEFDVPIPINLPVEEQIRLMYKHAYLAEANDTMAKMYGLRHSREIIGTRMSKMLVRKDPRNTEYLRAFIKSDYQLKGVTTHEKDIKGKDKYFSNSLVGIVKNKMLIRSWGTQQDLTDQIQTFLQLKKSETRLALALKTSRTGIWEWNLETGEIMWSDELRRLLCAGKKEEVTMDKFFSCVHQKDKTRVKTVVNRAIKNHDEFNLEYRVVWPDGSVHWVLSSGKTIFRNKKPISMIGSTVNIDDLVRRRELEKRAGLLSQQRTELLELNRAKDDFISLASHQLRTPATSVKQYVGMLIDGYGGKLTKKQQALLKTAFESNERQLSIIEDLLKVARLDAGKVRLKPRRTNVSKMMVAIMKDSRSIFEKRRQKTSYYPSKENIYAKVDGQRLRMAVENILENANKYTPKDKEIKVYLRQYNSYFKIKIVDQGIGIDGENMKNLFQKFSRIETPRSVAVSGNGLGLYWAKKIVDLHGGSVSASSKPNQGSIFSINIPLDQ